MDVVQDWAYQLLGDNANPALRLLTPYLSQLVSLAATANTFTTQLISQVTEKPDLATIALLLIILFVSLKLFNIFWQGLMFWVRVLRRVVFWGGLAMLGLWLYTRGPEGAMDDAQHWTSVWRRDYEYWLEREKVAKAVREGHARYGMGGPQAGTGWF